MRGALLLALGHRALPTTALPFVLEELESAHDAWLTAIAAHVLRKYPEPSASFAEPLRSAVLNIQHRDEIVRLARGGGDTSGGEKTTAMSEVMQTIGWLGRAGMACVPTPRGSARAESRAGHIDHGCQGDRGHPIRRSDVDVRRVSL